MSKKISDKWHNTFSIHNTSYMQTNNYSGYAFLTLSIILTLVNIFPALAQEEQDVQFVNKTFWGPRLINLQTTEAVPSNGFEFNIQHRFGLADVNEDLINDFFGMDLSSNIRFSLAFPITDRFYAGIGRTKFNKAVDFETKYTLIKQTVSNRNPISLAVYFNFTVNTNKFPEGGNFYHTDSITPFTYTSAHRNMYTTQLILARKLNRSFSVEFAPMFTYKNLAQQGFDNHTIILPVGVRYKFGLMSSVIAEYCPVLNKGAGVIHPYAIAYEIGTAGHAFQITISSSRQLLDQEIYTNPGADLLDGQFYLGFNISRMFWIKKQPF